MKNIKGSRTSSEPASEHNAQQATIGDAIASMLLDDGEPHLAATEVGLELRMTDAIMAEFGKHTPRVDESDRIRIIARGYAHAALQAIKPYLNS